MPGAGSRVWDYYDAGDTLAGLTVLDRLNDEPTQDRVLYLVEWQCCKRVQPLTHAAIKRRVDRGRATFCSSCAAHARTATRLGQPMPTPDEQQGASRVVIESGPWAGTYWHFGQLGPRWQSMGT